MPRKYLLLSVISIIMGGLFALGSTRANDEKIADASRVDNFEVQQLADRIEALEKRLAALEVRAPLIRQADNRAENEIEQPNMLWQNPITPEDDAARTDNDTRQKINGQSWSIRLLGHRK